MNWVFNNIIYPLFRKHFTVHYREEAPIKYKVYNVHANLRVNADVNESFMHSRLVSELSSSFLKNKVVHFKKFPLPNGQVEYSAQVVVIKK